MLLAKGGYGLFFDSWWVFGIIIVIGVVGFWLLFRSLGRWRQPPTGTDADAQVAEARLWSKKNIGPGG